jgi:hypothetical protein
MRATVAICLVVSRELLPRFRNPAEPCGCCELECLALDVAATAATFAAVRPAPDDVLQQLTGSRLAAWQIQRCDQQPFEVPAGNLQGVGQWPTATMSAGVVPAHSMS